MQHNWISTWVASWTFRNLTVSLRMQWSTSRWVFSWCFCMGGFSSQLCSYPRECTLLTGLNSSRAMSDITTVGGGCVRVKKWTARSRATTWRSCTCETPCSPHAWSWGMTPHSSSAGPWWSWISAWGYFTGKQIHWFVDFWDGARIGKIKFSQICADRSRPELFSRAMNHRSVKSRQDSRPKITSAVSLQPITFFKFFNPN